MAPSLLAQNARWAAHVARPVRAAALTVRVIREIALAAERDREWEQAAESFSGQVDALRAARAAELGKALKESFRTALAA